MPINKQTWLYPLPRVYPEALNIIKVPKEYQWLELLQLNLEETGSSCMFMCVSQYTLYVCVCVCVCHLFPHGYVKNRLHV